MADDLSVFVYLDCFLTESPEEMVARLHGEAVCFEEVKITPENVLEHIETQLKRGQIFLKWKVPAADSDMSVGEFLRNTLVSLSYVAWALLKMHHLPVRGEITVGTKDSSVKNDLFLLFKVRPQEERPRLLITGNFQKWLKQNIASIGAGPWQKLIVKDGDGEWWFDWRACIFAQDFDQYLNFFGQDFVDKIFRNFTLPNAKQMKAMPPKFRGGWQYFKEYCG